MIHAQPANGRMAKPNAAHIRPVMKSGIPHQRNQSLSERMLKRVTNVSKPNGRSGLKRISMRIVFILAIESVPSRPKLDN